MVIRQGDIFWVDFGKPRGSGPRYMHPCVVIQNNIFNRGSIKTTVVCVITSNTERAYSPGNVLLAKGDANLTKRCVANVTQIYTVDKTDLNEKIGQLSTEKLNSILSGLMLLFDSNDVLEA